LNFRPESLLRTISHRPQISRYFRETSEDFPKNEVLDVAKISKSYQTLHWN